MLQLNGKTLQLGRAFTTEDGRQYPANWLYLTTQEEKEAIGIVEVPDTIPQSIDTRFYWGVDNPKELAPLKEAWIARVKQTASSILKETDWYVVRQAENSAAVPADILSRRSEVRTLSNEKEAAITACEDVEALATYISSLNFTTWEPAPEPEPEPTPEPTPSEE